jgi:serine protease Do
MKKLFVAAMAFCCAALLNAQVKNYVCVVREQYYPSHIEFLEELRDSLKKRGYSTYSEYVDSYLKGGFGSGFLYVDKDGKNYIVTNRHVVSQAASASVEFENADGSLTKYEGLKVHLQCGTSCAEEALYESAEQQRGIVRQQCFGVCDGSF